MKIAFRLDAHPTIGMGHLSRCSTLAAVLMERGCRVLFILRRPSLEMAHQIRRAGLDLAELPRWEEASLVEDLPHAGWRGGSQEEDARQSAQAISGWTGGAACDWIVVDHYGLDRTWERAMRSSTRKILVVDDLADRPHECEFLVDVNAYLAPEQRYASLAPANCGLLLGPRFALLREEFQNDGADPAGGRREGPPVINVSFGGADPANLTGEVLSAIAPLGCPVEAVLGPMNPHAPSLTEKWGGVGSVRLHQDTREIAALFRRAHLAVGAAGGTTWERMRMGLPTLLYSLAGNQTRIAEDCSLRGACLYLGKAGDFSPVRLRCALQELLNDPARRLHMAEIGKRLVPPGGAKRVADVITDPAWRGDSENKPGKAGHSTRVDPVEEGMPCAGNPGSMEGVADVGEVGPQNCSKQERPTLKPAEEQILLRPAGPQDEELLYFWANDPAAREMSFHPGPIAFQNHQDWLGRKLADPSCRMFIVETSGRPAGQIRYDFLDDKASIGIYVAPSNRGRGLGSRLLTETEHAVLQVRNPCILEAFCFENNIASIRLFESNGFVRAAEALEISGRRCLSFHRKITSGADHRTGGDRGIPAHDPGNIKQPSAKHNEST